MRPLTGGLPPLPPLPLLLMCAWCLWLGVCAVLVVFWGLHMCFLGVAHVLHMCHGPGMARNGYRLGKSTVTLVLDPELVDRMRRKAARNGRSMQAEWERAALSWLGEEVEDDGRGAGPGRGRTVVADGGGPRPVAGGGGEDHARVGADRVSRTVGDLASDPFFDDLEFLPAVGDTRALRVVPDESPF